jgi:hypothetical protein
MDLEGIITKEKKEDKTHPLLTLVTRFVRSHVILKSLHVQCNVKHFQWLSKQSKNFCMEGGCKVIEDQYFIQAALSKLIISC